MLPCGGRRRGCAAALQPSLAGQPCEGCSAALLYPSSLLSPPFLFALCLPAVALLAVCVQVLGVLAGELGGLVEGSLRAAERCAVIEALLYLQVGLQCSFILTTACFVGVPECRAVMKALLYLQVAVLCD